ncbi:hypothetical protein HT136_16880 [Novosphingobium profundi]|nr:hypothetical protein [Novosphingobium profundi]
MLEPRSVPAPASVRVALADPLAGLAPIERRVVAIAREDGLDSLRTPRKRGWLARLVLGPTPPSRQLANERLEALRRLAVQAWHKGHLLPVSALREASHAGFSEDQVGAVIDTIGRARSARQFAPL